MRPFVYNALPARVVFGVGTIGQVADEVRRLDCRRALILSTPQQRSEAERLASQIGDLAAGVFAGAVMHTPVEVTARRRRSRRGRLRRRDRRRLDDRPRQGDRAAHGRRRSRSPPPMPARRTPILGETATAERPPAATQGSARGRRSTTSPSPWACRRSSPSPPASTPSPMPSRRSMPPSATR